MEIPKKIKEALTNAVKQKQLERVQKKLQEKEKTRIEDLCRRTHQVGKIELPLINGFAYDLMDKYFHPIDKMDLQIPEHLGIVVYILLNQTDESLIDMKNEDLRTLGLYQLMKIDQVDYLCYVACISDQFEMLKKKVSDQNMENLRNLEKLLDGATSVLDLPKE